MKCKKVCDLKNWLELNSTMVCLEANGAHLSGEVPDQEPEFTGFDLHQLKGSEPGDYLA